MAQRLAAGQPFPNARLSLSDDSGLSVPDDLGDGWKVVLLFRGAW